MPKKRKKKPVKKKAGFFAKLFDLFTALMILLIAAGTGYYFIFYDGKDAVEKEIVMSERELSVREIPEEPVIHEFDPSADEEEMRRLHDYDPIREQSEEYLSMITGGGRTDNKHSSAHAPGKSFERSIDKWANEYEGYIVRLGADPDRVKAADNSHLMCAIWRNSAKDNGMNFKPGYMQTEAILNNIVPIQRNEVKNGDLIVLQNGMIGMVVRFKSINDHSLIYASGTENKVVIIGYDRLLHYWLKPDNFKGYYRLKKHLIIK